MSSLNNIKVLMVVIFELVLLNYNMCIILYIIYVFITIYNVNLNDNYHYHVKSIVYILLFISIVLSLLSVNYPFIIRKNYFYDLTYIVLLFIEYLK
jgi:hypothetical protein